MPRMNILNVRLERDPPPVPVPPSVAPTPLARSGTYPSRCFYCTTVLTSDGHRSRHVAATPNCAAAEEAAVGQHQRRRAENPGAEGLDIRAEAQRCRPSGGAAPEAAPRSPKRRRRDQTSDVSSEQSQPRTHNPAPTLGTKPLPARVEASRTEPTSVRTHGANESEPTTSHITSGPTRRPFAETRGARNRQQRRPKHGFFVEKFPDPSAGEPITEERMAPVDLKAYIRSSGVMANPANLETAELLMTTGLKDSGKDRHLKSHLVSTLIAAQDV
jgi:hypothetical protein